MFDTFEFKTGTFKSNKIQTENQIKLKHKHVPLSFTSQTKYCVFFSKKTNHCVLLEMNRLNIDILQLAESELHASMDDQNIIPEDGHNI